MLVETTHKKGANSVEMCHPQNITHLSTRHSQLQVLHANELIQNHPPVHVCTESVYDEYSTSALSRKPLSLSLSLFLCPQLFSLRKTKKKKKNHSSHSDREQRKTWPGPVTFTASWLVEARCVCFVAVRTAKQTVLWALLWTQSYLSSPVRVNLHSRLKVDSFFFFSHCDTFCDQIKGKWVLYSLTITSVTGTENLLSYW